MGLLAWVIVGGIAGWLASMIMKTDANTGILANIGVGIVGALIGGFVVSLFGVQDALTGLDLTSILVAVLGSLILLWLVKLFQSKNNPPSRKK